MSLLFDVFATSTVTWFDASMNRVGVVVVEVSVTSEVLVVLVRKVYDDVLAFQRYRFAVPGFAVLPSQSTFRSSSDAADSFTVKTKRVNDLAPADAVEDCRTSFDVATLVYSVEVNSVVGTVFVVGGIAPLVFSLNAVFPVCAPLKS